MASIPATQQNLYATIIAATSAANKARAENTSAESGNVSGTNAANSTAVSISQQAQALAAASQASSSSGGSYDFTNIRPSDVLNTINSLVKSGQISLDESSSLLSFVPLTELNAAIGKPGVTNQPIDLFSGLKKSIDFNKITHNDAAVIYDQKALSALERLQGAPATTTSTSSAATTHDFTNMTPNQMRDVAQDLFNSGKIGSQQHLLLLTTSFVGRFPATKEYTPPTDADIARHNNTPMNYVQYCKDRISFLESAGLTSDPQHGYESWKGLLALMQNTTSSSAA